MLFHENLISQIYSISVWVGVLYIYIYIFFPQEAIIAPLGVICLHGERLEGEMEGGCHNEIYYEWNVSRMRTPTHLQKAGWFFFILIFLF